MTQLSNQFIQSAEKGQLALLESINLLNAKVDTGETETLVPGTAVKIKDVAGPVIIVEQVDADTDDIFGFVPYSVKKNEYVANDMIKIAFDNTVMIMEAGAAIARGADVEFAVASIKVITSAGVNKVVGKCLSKAAADGDLVAVLIKTPAIVPAALSLAGALVVGGALSVTGISTLTGNVVNGALNIESVNNYSAGAGALPIDKDVIFLTTGGAEALTLADGVAGQKLKIVMVSDGGDGTVTPANLGNGATLTFDDDGDSADLIFDGTSWWLVGTPTATLA